MKKLILLLLIVFAIMASCADDIIIPQQSPLRGAYRGLYVYIVNYNAGGLSPETHSQYVDWTFTDYNFYCNVNDSINDQWLCDFSGNYSLEDVLVLTVTHIGTQTCNRDQVPSGEFQLIRYQSGENKVDSLVITQILSAQYIKETLVLYPAD